MAYYLAAGQGAEIEELLNNVVILFDPSYNPDGLNRFASWVNTHKAKNMTADPNDREYSEAWPRDVQITIVRSKQRLVITYTS